MSVFVRFVCDADGCLEEIEGYSSAADAVAGVHAMGAGWRDMYRGGFAYLLCPDCVAALNRTAPHSTSPQFLHNPSDSQNTLKKGSQMREISKEGGTPSGSNPAGVASSSAGNHEDSAGTALNCSVRTHTKGPETAYSDKVSRALQVARVRREEGIEAAIVEHRRLFPAEPLCVFCEGGGCAGCEWTGVVVSEPEPAGAVQSGEGEGLPGRCRKCGAEFQAAVHGAATGYCDTTLCLACCESRPVLVPAAEGEVPPREVPEIRHCAAPAADDEPCSAVLGRDLYCTVCAGARCYGHCGGIDHLGGELISQGGSGRVEWRMRRVSSAGLVQAEYFAGQVTTEGAGGKVISKTFRAIESEICMKRMLAHVDQLLAAADGAPAYVPPEVRQLPPNSDEVQALLGLHAMQSDLDRKVEDMRHSMLRIRRAVVDAAFAWYERQREEWKLAPALQGMDAGQREACRQLHERQITDLFARIGGAL